MPYCTPGTVDRVEKKKEEKPKLEDLPLGSVY
jgi:hypothetical protein